MEYVKGCWLCKIYMKYEPSVTVLELLEAFQSYNVKRKLKKKIILGFILYLYSQAIA